MQNHNYDKLQCPECSAMVSKYDMIGGECRDCAEKRTRPDVQPGQVWACMRDGETGQLKWMELVAN